MNDIKQAWQQAKEEFKNRAFERFLLAKCFGNSAERGFNSNDDLELYLESGDLITLKTLQELFAHDVEVYGENAYSILEWIFDNEKDNDWKPFKNNQDVIDALNSVNYTVRRKISAALPFDLERANRGDVIEWVTEYGLVGEIVYSKDQSGNKFEEQLGHNMHFVFWKGGQQLVDSKDLRMKYPPKVAR